MMIDKFHRDNILFLDQLPGQKVAFVGVGGGSDGIQAAQIGLLMAQNGKELSCIVSIRSKNKKLTNYTNEPVQDIFHINENTVGQGRFHEPRLASHVQMLVAMDGPDLKDRVMTVIDMHGGADTVFLVDTGGDALYAKSDAVGQDTTPDQDLKVITDFSSGYKQTQFYTMIIAPGIDSPPQGPDRLFAANAVCYALSPTEKTQVLQNYQNWKMDGSTDELVGKTLLAWQAALKEQFGEITLPIPLEHTTKAIDPWNPKVNVVPSMANLFVMRLHDHLNIISS